MCLGHLGCLEVVVVGNKREFAVWIALVLVWSWNLEFSCIRKGAQMLVYMHYRRCLGFLDGFCARLESFCRIHTHVEVSTEEMIEQVKRWQGRAASMYQVWYGTVR